MLIARRDSLIFALQLRNRLLPLCVSAAAAVSGLPAAAGDSAFAQAVALYNRHKYANAIVAFAAILKSQPRNIDAAIYLANCYYSSGQSQAAATYYRWVVASFPQSPEAATAGKMLSAIGGSSASTSGTAAAASESVAGAQSDSAPDPAKMIRVVRPQADHPYCSKAFIQSVTDGLRQCPPKVLQLAMTHGCRVCITPTLVDRNPELRNSKPRGYEDGMTYKNTPAMFDGREVVVCEYAVIGENDDTWQPQKGALGALRHEFGHAIDSYLGYISQTDEFQHIYLLDKARIDPGNLNDMAYYIQAGTTSGGPSETFAQSCCIIFGGDTEDWRMKRDEVFKQSFPNVIKYVRKTFDNL